MKKPEEIKKGLEHCMLGKPCADCLYDRRDFPHCVKRLMEDTNACINVLVQRLAQVERERDAAVRDLSDRCQYCKHISCDDEDEKSPCKDCMQREGGLPFAPMIRTRFEWRGVCEENTKEEER